MEILNFYKRNSLVILIGGAILASLILKVIY